MVRRVLPGQGSRFVAAVALAALTLAAPGPALGGVRRPVNASWGLLGPKPELDELSWLVSGVHQSRPFRLAPDRSLSLLSHYLSPGQNHVAEWRSFFRGAYGFASWSSRLSLTWSASGTAPQPAAFSVSTRGPCPKWQAPRPVTIARYDGAEQATLPLIDCDGGIAPDAIDVLSVLSRAPGVPRAYALRWLERAGRSHLLSIPRSGRRHARLPKEHART